MTSTIITVDLDKLVIRAQRGATSNPSSPPRIAGQTTPVSVAATPKVGLPVASPAGLPIASPTLALPTLPSLPTISLQPVTLHVASPQQIALPSLSLPVHDLPIATVPSIGLGAPKATAPIESMRFKTVRQFVLPADLPALINLIKSRSILISPDTLNGRTNLRMLTSNASGMWIDELIKDILEFYREDAGQLYKWKMMLLEDMFTELRYLTVQIQENLDNLYKKFNPTQEDIRVSSERDARLKLSTPSKVKRGVRASVITELRLNATIADTISKALGTKYDVYKMIEGENFTASRFKLHQHVYLLSLMQHYGFDKIGLDGQQPIVVKTAGVSKSTLRDKFLSKTALQVPPTPFSLIPTTDPIDTPKKGKNAAEKPVIPSFYEELYKLVSSYPQVFENAPLEIIAAMRDGSLTASNYSKLASWISDCLLIKSEYQTAFANNKRLELLEKSYKWTLDDWQRTMIDAMKAGTSLIAVTPTSGGKTFTALSGLEWMLDYSMRSNTKIVIAVVAPTHDLALQTYCNVVSTFPRCTISMLTNRMADIKNGTQVWVGTPRELLVYFDTKKIKCNVGIFDEFHTVSTSFGSDPETILTASAICKLLSFCTNQVIALSATIHVDDIPTLQELITRQTGITKIEVITNFKRPVPQTAMVWTDGVAVPMTPETTVPFVEVTPGRTFQFLKLAVERDMAPLLFFDAHPEECYGNFTDYIEWIVKIEEAHYSEWHHIDAVTMQSVRALNHVMSEKARDYDIAIASGSKAINAILPRIRELASRRENLLASTASDIAKRIVSKIATPGYDGISTPLSARHFSLMREVMTYADGRSLNFEAGQMVPVEVPGLIEAFDEYIKAIAMRTDLNNSSCISSLPVVCSGVGPFFRIGDRFRQIDEIRSLFNSDMGSDGQSARREMLTLCEAERIREDEIRPLFDLIVRGLEYGVGIILPTMPFAVQFYMLKLLNNKDIKVIFSSREMSMGINYPIRTVVIRSNAPSEMNICEYLQMAGRSGRRRLDTHGYVIAWNIVNAPRANQDSLPYVTLPPITTTSGFQIEDPMAVAITIDQGRVFSFGASSGLENLSAAINKMVYTKVKKSSSSQDVDIEEDEKGGDFMPFDDDDDESHDGDVVASKPSSSVDDVALSSAITGCVTPLASITKMSEEDMVEIADRVQRITKGQILESMRHETYKWSRKIYLLKTALQELQIRFCDCDHIEWIVFIISVYELLHRVQMRQMRL